MEVQICMFFKNGGIFTTTHKVASKYSPPVLLHSTDPPRRVVTIFTTNSSNVPHCSIKQCYVFCMNIIKNLISLNSVNIFTYVMQKLGAFYEQRR